MHDSPSSFSVPQLPNGSAANGVSADEEEQKKKQEEEAEKARKEKEEAEEKAKKEAEEKEIAAAAAGGKKDKKKGKGKKRAFPFLLLSSTTSADELGVVNSRRKARNRRAGQEGAGKGGRVGRCAQRLPRQGPARRRAHDARLEGPARAGSPLLAPA